MTLIVNDRALETGVWAILEEECGAGNTSAGFGAAGFARWWRVREAAREFRFIGALGYGGKVWWDPVAALTGRTPLWVNCYREDETPERAAAIARANARLAELWNWHRGGD